MMAVAMPSQRSRRRRNLGVATGNPVKSDGALFAARTPPSAQQEPPRAAVAVAVVEEKAETKRQETWKVVVSLRKWPDPS